jgi:hypothetical protein
MQGGRIKRKAMGRRVYHHAISEINRKKLSILALLTVIHPSRPLHD